MTIGFPVYLDAEEVADRLGINPGSISAYVKAGTFPKPVKATRGKSEHGKARTRSYWRKSDIDDYQDLLLMQQEEAERYNDNLLASMRQKMNETIETNDLPNGLRNNKLDEILRGTGRETEASKRKPRLELLRGR